MHLPIINRSSPLHRYASFFFIRTLLHLFTLSLRYWPLQLPLGVECGRSISGMLYGSAVLTAAMLACIFTYLCHFRGDGISHHHFHSVGMALKILTG